MLLRHLILLLTVAAFGAGCSSSKTDNPSPAAPAIAAEKAEVVEGQIVVKATADHLAGLKSTYRVQTVDADNGIYQLFSTELNKKEASISKQLEEAGKVIWAEPNFIVTLSDVSSPRDPLWLSLWGLKNYGQDAPSGVEGRMGADISATSAWEVTTGSRDIVVAVIDTGIDYRHPDLRDNMWINEAELNGLPGVDEDGNGYADDIYGWDFVSAGRNELYHGQMGDPDPMDGNGHGTHCAGTIGASGSNGQGVVGVNWNVRLMAIKFLSDQGSGTTVDGYKSIMYAADNNVDVISASWGGGAPSRLVQSAIEAAEQNGAIFIAAAGNSSSDNDTSRSYPANYPVASLISVAATDNQDQLASFSSFGLQKVHIAAPGVSVMSTWPTALVENGSPYIAISGTSMATPHVSGAAALVLAARPELRGNPLALKNALLSTVDWMPHLASRVSSGGRLNVNNAVRNITTDTPVQAEWTERTVDLRTLRHSTEKVDQVLEIYEPEALMVQAHVQRALIDWYDRVDVYDENYRHIYSLPSMVMDQWLPAVQGEKMYVKFSNSIVQLFKFIGIQKFTEPPQDLVTQICWMEMGDTLWSCDVYQQFDPRPSFESEGLIIDRVRFVK